MQISVCVCAHAWYVTIQYFVMIRLLAYCPTYIVVIIIQYYYTCLLSFVRSRHIFLKYRLGLQYTKKDFLFNNRFWTPSSCV